MKRRLLIVAVFLLAGAVVNVAVAWGCAAFTKITDGTWHPIPEHNKQVWARLRPPDFPEVPRERMNVLLGFGLQYSAAVALTNILLERKTRRYILNIHSAGWPCLAMEGYEWSWPFNAVQPVTRSTSFLFSVSEIGLSWLGSRHLPLRPIWPGFAVNTTFYAALLWLLICGPFALRRAIRTRRGLCAKCAYPRGNSEVCSECGMPLPKRATEAI